MINLDKYFHTNLKAIIDFPSMVKSRGRTVTCIKVAKDGEGPLYIPTGYDFRGSPAGTFNAISATVKRSLKEMKGAKSLNALSTTYKRNLKVLQGLYEIKESYHTYKGFGEMESLIQEVREAIEEVEKNVKSEFSLLKPAVFLKVRDLKTLDSLFGKERIDLIGKRYAKEKAGVDFEAIRKNGGMITNDQFDILMLGIADVRMEDMQDLFHEIKQNPKIIRHLNPDQTQKLIQKLSSAQKVEDLTKEQYDILWNVLAPFASIDDLPWAQRTIVAEKAKDSGHTITGIKERVRLVHELHEGKHWPDEVATTVKAIEWDYKILKRMNDREPPDGVIIPHPEGFYQVFKTINGGGSYKILMKSLGADSKLPSCVSARGTRATPTATDNTLTLQEDARLNIGSNGPKVTYEETLAYLTDPTIGFAKQKDEKFRLIGFSLGGAHAQRDCCLFLDQAESLVTLCSAGVDRSTVEWFKDKSGKLDHFHVTHIVETDDRVHHMGDGFLGEGCKNTNVVVSYYILEPCETDEIVEVFEGEVPKQPELKSEWLASSAKNLVVALGKAHIRDTLETDNFALYHIDNIGNEKLLNDQLDNREKKATRNFEEKRQYLAQSITGTDPEEFVKYLDSKKKQA